MSSCCVDMDSDTCDAHVHSWSLVVDDEDMRVVKYERGRYPLACTHNDTHPLTVYIRNTWRFAAMIEARRIVG